jgi:hypothetical protein
MTLVIKEEDIERIKFTPREAIEAVENAYRQ